MDPEELPYETPYERSFNRIVEQLAQGNLEKEMELQRILEASAPTSGHHEMAAIGSGDSGDTPRAGLSVDEAMEIQHRRWDGLPPGHYTEGDMVVVVPERPVHNSTFTPPAIGNLSTGAVELGSGSRPPGMANISGGSRGNEAIGNPTGVVVEPSSDPRPPGMAEPTGGLASNSSTGAGSGVVYTPLRDWLRRLGNDAGGQTGSGGGPPCQPVSTPRECPACPPTTSTPVPRLCGPDSPGGGDLGGVALSTPMAILVGAVATLLVCALAAAIGIILRYMPILMSGLLVLAAIAVVWYFSSTQPAAARECGRRLWAFLRETATSVVDRAFRRNSQVRIHLILR
jgi:hypothetical protein